MRDIFVVLTQKEAELQTKQDEVRKLESEIEILRTAANMLSEEGERAPHAAKSAAATAPDDATSAKASRVAATGLQRFP